MCLTVPASDARQPMRDVFDLDVERRGIEKIQPPPTQHALPSARRLRIGCDVQRSLFVAWRDTDGNKAQVSNQR